MLYCVNFSPYQTHLVNFSKVNPQQVACCEMASIINDSEFSSEYLLPRVQRWLTNFETHFENDSLAQNSIPETDLKFFHLLVCSFPKIFTIWRNSSVFKNNIESDLFYDAYSLMFESLNCSDDYKKTEKFCDPGITAVCEICDEEFSIDDNDLNSSYAKHEKTPQHIEIVKTFSWIGTSKSFPSSDSVQKTDINSMSIFQPEQNKLNDSLKHVTPNVSLPKKFIDESIVFLGGNEPSCKVCNIKLCSNEFTLSRHVESYLHKYALETLLKKKEIPSKKTSIQDLNETDENDSKQNSTKNETRDVDSKSSKIMVDGYNEPFELSTEKYRDILINQRGVIICNVCKVNLVNKGNIISHIHGNLHKFNTKGTPSKWNNVEKQPENVEIYCCLCKALLIGIKDMEHHMISRPHKSALKTQLIFTRKSNRFFCNCCLIEVSKEGMKIHKESIGHKYNKNFQFL